MTYYLTGLALGGALPFLGIMMDLSEYNEGRKVSKVQKIVYNSFTYLYGVTIVLTNLAYIVMYIFNLRQYVEIVFWVSMILNYIVTFGLLITNVFIDKENS